MIKVVVKRQIEASLGRFGPVQVGDVLHLTEQEWKCVENDRRFARLNGAPPKQPEAETPVEEARRDRLAQQNNERHVFECELQELTRQELLARARKLRDEGKPIVFREPDESSTLRKAILAVTFGEPVGEEVPVQTE